MNTCRAIDRPYWTYPKLRTEKNEKVLYPEFRTETGSSSWKFRIDSIFRKFDYNLLLLQSPIEPIDTSLVFTIEIAPRFLSTKSGSPIHKSRFKAYIRPFLVHYGPWRNSPDNPLWRMSSPIRFCRKSPFFHPVSELWKKFFIFFLPFKLQIVTWKQSAINQYFK